MVEIFLLLMFLVNVGTGIFMVHFYKGMWHDLFEIKDDLNEIEEETREIK